MSEPLNPSLYRRLKRHFGHVRISNEGEEMIASYKRDFLSGRDYLAIEHWGEKYHVCCPECHDTKFRLYLSYKWGIIDTKGRSNLWLSKCYNEDCFSKRRVVDDLYDDLEEIAGVLGKARVLQGKIIDVSKLEVEPPGRCVTLDKLAPDHPANQYLSSRFYDPERLGRFYGVGYCSTSDHYLARGRIYAPLVMNGKLKGYQCRYVGDLDWKDKRSPPKWWSCPNMKRAHLIYNFDQMKQWQTGVIEEGPGDVWGFGPMGGATLGDKMTVHQQRLYISAFKKYSGVLLYDPESMCKPTTERLATKLSSALKGGCAPVTLPYGDPGSLDRRFMRDYVRKEAKAMGVKVIYKRR